MWQRGEKKFKGNVRDPACMKFSGKYDLRQLHSLLPYLPTCCFKGVSVGHSVPPELKWLEVQQRVGSQWPACPLTQLSHFPRFKETEAHGNRL